MTDKGDVLPISAVEFDPQNARVRTERSSYMIKESLQKFGPLRSLVGQRLPDGRIIVRAGNGTLEEAGQIGIDKVRIVERRPDELVVVVADDLDESAWKSYAIADNRSSDLSDWDTEILAELAADGVEVGDWFTSDEMAAWDVGMLTEEGWGDEDEPEGDRGESQGGTGSLKAKFIIPPFSVLDARQGYWQERKRQWLALGIQSELGRGGGMTYADHEWQMKKLGHIQAPTQPQEAH